MIDALDVPVVGAPMAGGPTTPALAAAVSEAGGLGFLAAGYKTAEAVEAEISAVRAATSRPFGVNLFFPTRDETDEAAIAAYARSLRAEEERYGVSAGAPRGATTSGRRSSRSSRASARTSSRSRSAAPSGRRSSRCASLDIAVWATVTTPAEAQVALAAGVDALVLQGGEAGGHQGSFRQHDDEPLSILTLLQLVAAMTDRPLVAAGGIATAAGIAAVRRAGSGGGADRLRADARRRRRARASRSEQALRGQAPTRLTRAFTGRRARGIVNRFMRRARRRRTARRIPRSTT